MSKPVSDDSNSQQFQHKRSIHQNNNAAMGNGQQAAIGNYNVQFNGDNNNITIQTNSSKKPGIAYQNSFLDCLIWIYQNSQGKGLASLKHKERYELQDVISFADQVCNHDFTKFELEILKLVFSYCCCYKRKFPFPWNKFNQFEQQDYYYEMQNLINSKRRIRYGDIRLSSLVCDPNLSQLLRRIE